MFIRSCIDLFDDKKMDKTQKDRRSWFAMFAELHFPKLKELELIKENFADEMLKFYKKNSAKRPTPSST
jgi:hypothetical protein